MGETLEDGYVSSEWRIVRTPTVDDWINKSSTKEQKKRFFKKIDDLVKDLVNYGYPRRGVIKSVRHSEATVFYIRINQEIRLLFDYDVSTKPVQLFLLDLSDKSTGDFNDKLKRSAEHLVFAKNLDRLGWQGDDFLHELQLSEGTTSEQIEEFRQRQREQFSNRPENERQEWSEENYRKRIERATIYQFQFPKASTLEQLAELIETEGLDPILKLQMKQMQLLDPERFFQLEGVAGTGKTTILLLRFVNDINAALEASKIKWDIDVEHDTNCRHVSKEDECQEDCPEDCPREIKCSEGCSWLKHQKDISKVINSHLFVTHNIRLRDDVKKHLKYYFGEKLLRHVQSRILTIDDLFLSFLDKSEKEFFDPKHRLRRRHFKQLLPDKLDIDLFYEEYRGVLRGYNLAGQRRMLSKEEYDELGRSRGRISQNLRNQFYSIAKEFESLLEKDPYLSPKLKGWDDQDLCDKFHQKISNLKFEKLDTIYIDECQDLTYSQMKVICGLLDKDVGRLACAGDLAQSVQPSSFTWNALRDVIFDVFGITPSDEHYLDQNYRSTPYLVHAANLILKLQCEFEGRNTEKIQRPFAFENTGDPVLIFKSSEEEFIKILNLYKLPSATCPLLVRSKETKKRLSELLEKVSSEETKGRKNFIETFAGYKGLENKSVLIWDPAEGSERFLDKMNDPKRGQRASEGMYANHTTLLELRQVFVGITRARHLLGIVSPESSHFVNHLVSDDYDFIVEEEDNARMGNFAEDIDSEGYAELAIEYEGNGKMAMAAQCYRDAGSDFDYHRCKGLEEYEEGNIVEAAEHYFQAVDCAESAEQKTRIRKMLFEISRDLLRESSKKKREEILGKLVFHASEEGNTKMELRFNAEYKKILAERGRKDCWPQAGDSFFKLGDYDVALKCFTMAGSKIKIAQTQLKMNNEKEALVTIVEYLALKAPKRVIKMLLGFEKVTKAIKERLPADLRKLKFKDNQLAERIATKHNLSRFLRITVLEKLLETKNMTTPERVDLIKNCVSLERWTDANSQYGKLDGFQQKEFENLVLYIDILLGLNDIKKLLTMMIEAEKQEIAATILRKLTNKRNYNMSKNIISDCDTIIQENNISINNYWRFDETKDSFEIQITFLKLILEVKEYKRKDMSPEILLDRCWADILSQLKRDNCPLAQSISWIYHNIILHNASLDLRNKYHLRAQLCNTRFEKIKCQKRVNENQQIKAAFNIAFVLFTAYELKSLKEINDAHTLWNSIIDDRVIAHVLSGFHNLFNRNTSGRKILNYTLDRMKLDIMYFDYRPSSDDLFEDKNKIKRDLSDETKNKKYLISEPSNYKPSRNYNYIGRWFVREEETTDKDETSSKEVVRNLNEESEQSKDIMSEMEILPGKVVGKSIEISNQPSPTDSDIPPAEKVIESVKEDEPETEMEAEMETLDDILSNDGDDNIFSGNILPELISVIGSSNDPREMTLAILEDKIQGLNEIEISEMLIQTFTGARKSDFDIVVSAGILLAIYDFGTQLKGKTDTTYVGQMERTFLREIQKNHLNQIREDGRSKTWWQRLLTI